GVAPLDWPPGVLARGRVAGVLGVAEAAVRVRRPDDARRALSGAHSTAGAVDAVSQRPGGPGILCPASQQRGGWYPRRQPVHLGVCDGGGRVLGVSARRVRADGQRRIVAKEVYL